MMKIAHSIIQIFNILLLSCLLFSSSVFAADKASIRFGILSIAQPSRTLMNWQPFADYMSKAIGQEVELVVPRGFGKMKEIIANGKVDFFYINSHVYYKLKQDHKAVPVAQMLNIENKVSSRSQFFVRRDSDIFNIQDLKGKKIAYVSPMGAGGYLAPRAHLFYSGLTSGVDYHERFTKNLSNSIYGVLLGDYDVAAMCGVSYKLMSKKIKTGELRIIAQSDAYPESMIGARFNLSEETINVFSQAVINMKNSLEGKKILNNMYSMKIKSFVQYNDDMEDITKKLLLLGRN